MPAPDAIRELVERFQRNAESYRSPAYNETQARREFIDPMFKALGWDVDNAQGYAEAYKDVVHEDSLKIGAATKAPDYSFRVGGARKFFLEAKKPAAGLRDDPAPAYQLRRYAWSAKLSLSVLTNFAEFAVYDSRVRPDQTDKSSAARILYLTHTDYVERWDEIASIFSREAVLRGSFDKYAESATRKKGTAEVDAAFLAEIEKWREELARVIALRNPGLSQRDLNYAVQQTIDRIVFLRMCEDRGIEDYGRLQALLNGAEVYARLRHYYEQADQRYNSGLFHFHREKDRRGEPDTLTPSLSIDDKALKDIVRTLYYPESPYEFSVLPADILGQVYERFLGKVIRLTEGHRAVVEEKPEVRKAGGVYYTPTYIVDYIVRQTVGKLLEGRAPGPRGSASRLRILDPACGSGSFLLGAYEYLLKWHLEQYTQKDDPKKWAKGRSPAVFQNRRGEWRLTSGERKRVLLNNIYGVDIDTQAVEVTKLSLLLKVLEDENAETLQKQLAFHHERALPDLAGNVKCGNSLIGTDFHNGRQRDIFENDDTHRINAFDWTDEFPEVVQNGGFDAAIGNPPYVRIQTLKESAPVEVELYKTLYASAASGNYDIYVVFVEKALSLLNETGRIGFILPHKFFNAQYGEGLRRMISGGKYLSHVVHFGDQQVFAGATTYTCLLFLDKAGASKCRVVRVDDLDAWREEGKGTETRVPVRMIAPDQWNFVVGAESGLLAKLEGWPTKLADVADRMAQGIRTSANEVYVLDVVRETRNAVTAWSGILGREVKIERKAVLPFLQGREIKPYRVLPSGKVVIVPYTIEKGRAALMPEKEMRERLPLLHAYLAENKKMLASREKKRFRGARWYQFGRKQNVELMRLPKILVPDIADRASFALDEKGEYAFTSGYGITLRPDAKESPKYVLALLNSSLLNFHLKRISTPMRGGFFRYFTQFIGQLPIRRIDFSDKAEKAIHDRIVSLSDFVTELHRRIEETTGHSQTVIERRMKAALHEIDRLVYELYGLTEDEIAIVEKG